MGPFPSTLTGKRRIGRRRFKLVDYTHQEVLGCEIHSFSYTGKEWTVLVRSGLMATVKFSASGEDEREVETLEEFAEHLRQMAP